MNGCTDTIDTFKYLPVGLFSGLFFRASSFPFSPLISYRFATNSIIRHIIPSDDTIFRFAWFTHLNRSSFSTFIRYQRYSCLYMLRLQLSVLNFNTSFATSRLDGTRFPGISISAFLNKKKEPTSLFVGNWSVLHFSGEPKTEFSSRFRETNFGTPNGMKKTKT